MKKNLKLFKVNEQLTTICTEKCDHLLKIPTFNMNFVFVSSYYTDRSTALDFMSRLGNFECLEDYQHYYTDLGPETQEYMNTLNGIVYDRDLTDIYIFISDILIPNNVNYKILSTITNL